MRFLLMMHAPWGTGDYQMGEWPREDVRALMDFMTKLNEDLRASGEMTGGEGLAPPRDARIVRAGDDGPLVTDGPFPETKEFLAGYWMVEVDSAERAYEIAARASAAPGPGGAPLRMPIEVRQVMDGPPA